MNKRLVDVEDTNRYLFDLLFRHQVYLEGVKAGFARNYSAILRELYGEFAKFVGQSRYDTLDAFTRVELQQFIRRFQMAQTRVYNQYTQQLIDLLKQFVAADVEVTHAIYSAVTGKTVEEIAAATPTADTLWAHISTAIIPANGLTISTMLTAFATSTSTKINQQLFKSSVNDQSVGEALTAIVGDSTLNYRDGLFGTFNSQNTSIIATAIQHVSSLTQASVGAVFYDQYQWVAILDSRTTEICRSRDGKVYVYGEGPLPPAHYNCRSKAVSLTQDSELHDIPDDFYAWLTTQPETVLADMLGDTTAAKVLSGSATVKDISVSDAVIPLTLTQFKGKISLIVM